MARVNQPPWLHQLVVLSIGWVFCLHPAPDAQVTNIVPQATFFSCWSLVFFFLALFLSPDLQTTLPPSYPTNLAILFTYVLSLPTNYNQPPYLLTLYPFKAKSLPFDKISISSWLNLYLLAKLFSSSVKPLFIDKTFLLWLNLYLLVKIFYCVAKPLLISKTF
jgi:hypothetical protein